MIPALKTLVLVGFFTSIGWVAWQSWRVLRLRLGRNRCKDNYNWNLTNGFIRIAVGFQLASICAYLMALLIGMEG
jgi:hypothetical protein